MDKCVWEIYLAVMRNVALPCERVLMAKPARDTPVMNADICINHVAIWPKGVKTVLSW